MKKASKLMIILIAFVLCCTVFGSAFALYKDNSKNLSFEFEGSWVDTGDHYFVKVFNAGTLVSTVELDLNTAADEGIVEYFGSFFADKGNTIEFYINSTKITDYYDDYYSAIKKQDGAYTSEHTNHYTVYLKVTYTTIYIGADQSYYIYTNPNGALTESTKLADSRLNYGHTEYYRNNVTIAAGTKLQIKKFDQYISNIRPGVGVLYDIVTEDGDTYIVIKKAGTYDIVYDTVDNNIWIGESGVSYTTITSYANAKWIGNANAKFYAVDNNGNIYHVLARLEDDNKYTIILAVPSTVTSITVWRVSPSVTIDNFMDADSSLKWNNSTRTSNNFGETWCFFSE